MSLQDSLTSTTQGKANWNSRSSLSRGCARFEGDPCLPGPASCSPPPTPRAGSKALKGRFHDLQSGVMAAPRLTPRMAWLARSPE